MKSIFSSASKLVFVFMAIALIALTFKKIIEAKDFIMLVSMAFTYYFTRDRGNTSSS